MSGILVNLIVQIIAGAVGGNVAGAAGGKTIDLGTALNSIVGAIGGGVGGQLLTALIPVLAGAANNIDIGALGTRRGRRRCWRDPHGHRWPDQKQDGDLAD